MQSRICALLVATTAITSCTKAGTPTPSDSAASTPASAAGSAAVDAKDARHAIDSIYVKFTDALARSDAKTLGAMYASDAIVDVPGAPLLTGSDAIMKALEQDFAQVSFKNPTLNTDDVITGGNLAVETGSWSWSVQPKSGGKAEMQKGPYITVWRREADGTWKILRDYVTVAPAQK